MPSAVAIVLADSPLACTRSARPAFFSSSASRRPMCCPRARRASRAAGPALPSEFQFKLRQAGKKTPATIRPVAFDVSIPSRNDPQDDVPNRLVGMVTGRG